MFLTLKVSNVCLLCPLYIYSDPLIDSKARFYQTARDLSDKTSLQWNLFLSSLSHVREDPSITLFMKTVTLRRWKQNCHADHSLTRLSKVWR